MVKIEEELSAIGENQKQLEISEEKARRREEKYQVRTRKKTKVPDQKKKHSVKHNNSIASLVLQKALNRLRIYQINRVY